VLFLLIPIKIFYIKGFCTEVEEWFVSNVDGIQIVSLGFSFFHLSKELFSTYNVSGGHTGYKGYKGEQ
jgi:hypothetical protein